MRSTRPPGFRTRRYSRERTSRSATWRRAKPMLSMSKQVVAERQLLGAALHQRAGERLSRLPQHADARIDADHPPGSPRMRTAAARHQTGAGRDVEQPHPGTEAGAAKGPAAIRRAPSPDPASGRCGCSAGRPRRTARRRTTAGRRRSGSTSRGRGGAVSMRSHGPVCSKLGPECLPSHSITVNPSTCTNAKFQGGARAVRVRVVSK